MDGDKHIERHRQSEGVFSEQEGAFQFHPTHLAGDENKLNLFAPEDIIFWAACLVLFFGLLRKLNVFGAPTFHPEKQLTRDCFTVENNHSLTVHVKWSKTIQKKERSLKIVFHSLHPHPLCPVTAVLHAFKCTQPCEPKAQAFPLFSAKFNHKITALAGPSFSSYSFCRGGVTHTLSCNIPLAIIKASEDWQSKVFLNYLDQLPQTVLDHYRHVFANNLPSVP